MSSQTLAWVVLIVAGAVTLVIDVWLGARKDDVRLRTAVVGTVGWTLAGLAFVGVVAGLHGTADAGRYLTVYLLEKSLSLDNVAVFAVVLTAFAIPSAQRRQVLLGGILAALVLRIGLVVGGLAIVSAVHDILVAFGVLLLLAGVRMAWPGEQHEKTPRAVGWLLRRNVSPAAAALVVLGVADLVFAIDSVPAAFAVTRTPYVVIAANVFAILGLRPMYDLLAFALDRLVYLRRALGVLLALIGVALCVEPVWAVPEWLLLLAVVLTVGTGVLTSLVRPRRIFVTVAGGLLLAAGAAMLVLPGPGLVVLAGGLALLATEFVWAKRLLNGVRNRIPKRSRGREATSSRG